MTKQAGKLDLNWMQTTGSALAALSSAVLLSTLGAAGTLIGAAVGSIVVTVGGTVYSHYLSVSRERMAAARSAALVRVSRGAGTRATATGGAEAVTRALAESPERFPLLAASARGGAMRSVPGGAMPGGASPRSATPAVSSPVTATPGAPRPRLIDGNLPGTRPSLRQMLRGSRWKPALAVSLGVFVLVMGAIVSMELATGRALSSYTGGSSADGPRTSIALLGSTSDARGSTTTDPAETGTGEGSPGSGDTTGSDAGSRSAGDSGTGSTAGSDSDTAPQPDTSTTDPDAGTPTEPAPEPAPTEPAPAPTPAPSTQAPAPAPATGAAVGGAAADSVS